VQAPAIGFVRRAQSAVVALLGSNLARAHSRGTLHTTRALRFAWVLTLVAVPTPGQNAAASFSAALPPAVVDVSGWETITGEFETPGARGVYVFHVNPRRQAIYQVMRYQVELLRPTSELQRRRGSDERVAFVRNPGAREPMLCWQRDSEEAVPSWRALTSGTEEYTLEMGVLMRVLAVHRVAPRSSSRNP